jgi:uncharacterized membrane protein
MPDENSKTEEASANTSKPVSNPVNLDPNISAVFCYLIPVVGGIIFLITDKKSKFVKFHATQSILFWVLVWGASLIATSLRIIYIGFILSPMISLAAFAIWVFLMVKAYRNEEYELPYLGKIAKDHAEH